MSENSRVITGRVARPHNEPGRSQTSSSKKRQNVSVVHKANAVSAQNTNQGVPEATALLALLEVEREAREAQTRSSLYDIIANQTPRLTAARQAFVFETGRRKKPRLVAATSLAVVDRTVPLVASLEQVCADATASSKPDDFTANAFNARDFASNNGNPLRTYPFQEMFWLPLISNGDAHPVGGMLLCRERPWAASDGVVAQRLARTFAHALRAQSATKPRRHISFGARRVLMAVGALALTLALCLPVPLTVLAPLEVTPRDPFIVAAPISGVVKEITIAPNAEVKAGDQLVVFDDTNFKNALELAQREVLVASATLKRAHQLAFSDNRGRHELGLARAQLALKTAERDYANDLLQNTRILAQRDGIAVFTDKNSLVGKPVSVGERIMQIADTGAVEIRIDVPLTDSIILQVGAPVTLYLDSNPLAPRQAVITQANYEATQQATGSLSYTVMAALSDDENQQPPRIGVRGTAQISGPTVSLAYFLFRKPIAFVRQWVGL